MHTAANKLTELLLFLMPLTAQVIDLRLSAAVACAAATFAVVQELYFIIAEKGKSKMKKYHAACVAEYGAWGHHPLLHGNI